MQHEIKNFSKESLEEVEKGIFEFLEEYGVCVECPRDAFTKSLLGKRKSSKRLINLGLLNFEPRIINKKDDCDFAEEEFCKKISLPKLCP